MSADQFAFGVECHLAGDVDRTAAARTHRLGQPIPEAVVQSGGIVVPHLKGVRHLGLLIVVNYRV